MTPILRVVLVKIDTLWLPTSLDAIINYILDFCLKDQNKEGRFGSDVVTLISQDKIATYGDELLGNICEEYDQLVSSSLSTPLSLSPSTKEIEARRAKKYK